MNTDVVDISDRESDGCIILDIQAQNFTYPQTAVLENPCHGTHSERETLLYYEYEWR